MRIAQLLALGLLVVGIGWFATRTRVRIESTDLIEADGADAGDTASGSDAGAQEQRGVRQVVRQEEASSPIEDAVALGSIAVGPVDVSVFQPSLGNGKWPPQVACAVALLTVSRTGSSETIAHGVTDGAGKWEFRSVAVRRANEHVMVQIVEPGYVQRRNYVRWTDDQPNGLATLVAEPGGSARGRLVDEAGQGVVGRLAFRQWTEHNGRRRFERILGGKSAPDGSFSLDVVESKIDTRDGVLRGTIVATTDDAGTGVLTEQAWDPRDLPQDLLVLVRGGGQLIGTIRDSHGAPAAGLPIRASLVGVAKNNGYSFFGDEEGAECLVADGLAQGKTVTRADGTFELRGLRPGEYHVRTKSSTAIHHSVYDVPVTVDPVPTGTDPVELIYGRPAVLVSLEDASGIPWSEPIDVQRRHRSSSSLPGTWPARVQIHLVPARRFEGRWIARDRDHLAALGGTATGDGAAAFDVEPGTDYLLSVIGINADREGFDGSRQHVRLADGHGLQRVTVRARTLAPLGFLEVAATVTARMDDASIRFPRANGQVGVEERDKVRTADPVPYSAWGRSLLVIEDTATGMPVLSGERLAGPQDRFELPAGRYRVAVRMDAIGSQSDMGNLHGGATVDVVSGKTVVARLDIGPGGEVRVKVASGSGPYWLYLIDSNGQRGNFPWCSSRKDMSRWLTNVWSSGPAQTSEVLPAGDYTVVGKRQGGDSIPEIAITIVDGEITELRLD